MIGLFVLLGGIVLFVTIIVVLDAIGQRQRRNAGKS
jgi:hypothetical protein